MIFMDVRKLKCIAYTNVLSPGNYLSSKDHVELTQLVDWWEHLPFWTVRCRAVVPTASLRPVALCQAATSQFTKDALKSLVLGLT